MNKVTHKYIVNIRLLEEIERFVQDKNPTVDELKAEFRRLKIFYRHGLSELER